MRSAFHLCGMPLRRPRSSRKRRSPPRSSTQASSPLPPPLPLSAPPLSPLSSPAYPHPLSCLAEREEERDDDAPLCADPALHAPSLARFAEDAASTDAGLSDVDFSTVVDPDIQPEVAAAKGGEQVPTPMVMDTVSRKWVGNERDFERFNDEVRRAAGPAGNLVEDYAPFRVGNHVEREWQSDAREHNHRVGSCWKDPTALDIRDLAAEFEPHRRRRSQAPRL